MTPKQAYRMGFRHITDLAEMHHIAECFGRAEDDERLLRLMEAWHEGTLAAKALLDREFATVH